jgi:hypothetical protein
MLQERVEACRYDLALGKTERSEGRMTTTEEARERGVRAALQLDGGILVCEIAVPLGAAPGDPYGVPAVAGTIIGIGLETGRPERGQGLERPSGGPPPGAGIVTAPGFCYDRYDMERHDDRHGDPIEDALLEAARSDEDRAVARGIRIEADRIVSLILGGEAGRSDVEEAVADLRADVLEIFPGGEDLFEAIYLSRFRRLWEQFRPDDGRL